jgi:D-aspartate ligase
VTVQGRLGLVVRRSHHSVCLEFDDGRDAWYTVDSLDAPDALEIGPVPRDPAPLRPVPDALPGASAALGAWLAGIDSNWALAVVLGGGPNALSFARSLGRRRVPVLVVDGARGFAGSSRWARSVVLPGPSEHPETWVRFLRWVGDDLSRPAALFPTNDTLVSLVADHEAELADRFRAIVPRRDDVETIVDKGKQYRAAAAAGIPVPRTELPTSHGDIVRIAAGMRYPCLLKPHRSLPGRAVIEHKRKVDVVENPRELVVAYDRLASPDNPFLVQERVPGPDSELFYYLGFWDRPGHEHSWMTARKVWQFPGGIGDGSTVESARVSEVATLARVLLRALRYRGLVNVEFKRDPDGRFLLIEVNPRTVAFNQLATTAGMDFPWIAYRQIATALHPRPSSAFRTGVRYTNEDLELSRLVHGEVRLPEGLRPWVSSLVRSRAWAIASVRDPAPLLRYVTDRVRGAVGQRSSHPCSR